MMAKATLLKLSAALSSSKSILKANMPITAAMGNLRQFSLSANRQDSFKIQDLDDFKEKVTNSDLPVVVDFFATWCGPCRLLTPRIESVIAEKAGKVNLAKVDIDELTELALEYEVSSVPVLVAMKGGKELARIVGLQDPDKLRTFVNNLVPS